MDTCQLLHLILTSSSSQSHDGTQKGSHSQRLHGEGNEMMQMLEMKTTCNTKTDMITHTCEEDRETYQQSDLKVKGEDVCSKPDTDVCQSAVL